MNWFCPPVSSFIPSRSFVKTSWGSLQPHPFRSAKLVSRKLGSKSWSVGSKGFTGGFGIGWISKVSGTEEKNKLIKEGREDSKC